MVGDALMTVVATGALVASGVALVELSTAAGAISPETAPIASFVCVLDTRKFEAAIGEALSSWNTCVVDCDV